MNLKIWELLLSKPLIAALTAMFSAQILKMFFPLIKGAGVDMKKFVSYGDIPSSHTAFIVAVTVSIGFQDGWKSSLFALAVVVSCIIIYDIIKLRKTVELNMIMTRKLMESNDLPLEDDIPQFKGHSQIEIIAGAVWGVCCAVLIYLI